MAHSGDVLCLHAGQCGVQVGAALALRVQNRLEACGTAGKKAPENPLASLVVRRADQGLVPRFVAIDSEPKAVAGATKARGARPAAAVWTEGGRGGVFANGFHSVGGGARGSAEADHRGSLLDSAMDAVRKWSESAASTPDVLLIHSLAGGTGAGLGTRLLEEMRDNGFQKAFLVTASVVPLSCGESPLQAVNTALSLSALAEHTDAALLLQNDDAVRAAVRSQQPGLQGANAYLAALLERTLAAHGPEGLTPLRDIVVECAPIPTLKFLEAHTSWPAVSNAGGGSRVGIGAPPPRPPSRMAQSPPPTWREVLKSQLTPLVHRTHADGVTRAMSSASMALAAGTDADAAEALAELQLNRTFAHVPWQSQPWRIRARPLPLLYGETRHLTVIANRSTAADVLDAAVERTTALNKAGAFVHHYARFGLDEDDWSHACARLSDVADAYRAFHAP